MKKTYSELLKDPRWQKKRLEILSRDKFRCACCMSDDKTLHVHHQFYINDGRLPWEYSDQLLVTLCEDCHKFEESLKPQDDSILQDLLTYKILRQDIHQLVMACIDVLTEGSTIFSCSHEETRLRVLALIKELKSQYHGEEVH